MEERPNERPLKPWQRRIHDVIFEADTTSGQLFDVGLLIAIAVSVLIVLMKSEESIDDRWHDEMNIVQWGLTILFTIEYTLRLICVKRPLRYASSFFGVVDLLAIMPSYLSLFIGTSPLLAVLRSLRLLRVFHIFKMGPYVAEIGIFKEAIHATKAKIVVFLMILMTCVLLLGTAVYAVESLDEDTQFTSIPRAIYWAIVTITTVGYGDIAPQTIAGQCLAATAMLLGYCMIIVPVAIFSVEVMRHQNPPTTTQSCPSCIREGHAPDAVYCKHCGEKL